MACVHVPPATGRLASGINCVQRTQRDRRRALPPTLPRRCCGASLRAQNEVTQHSSAVQDFCTKPSMGSRGHSSVLPVGSVTALPCNAEARAEPSRRLCSFFRKSKDFYLGKLICRCNASSIIDNTVSCRCKRQQWLSAAEVCILIYTYTNNCRAPAGRALALSVR